MGNSNQQSGQSARGGLANLLHDSFCCGLLLVDVAGKLELVSPEAAAALGIVNDLQGVNYHELPGGIAAVLDQVRSTGESLQNFRAQLQTQTSDLAWLSISVIPISENRPPALAVLLKYVTTAGKLEPDLRHLDRLATLGALAASSAHEVKNALVAVRTFIDLLLEKNQDAELAGIVRSEMGRIGSIISRMLVLAGPTQGEFTRLCINEVLERLPPALGEFTVVLDIGRTTDISVPEPSSEEFIVQEFGRITALGGLSRRRVINQLARAHGLPPNQVYETIERAKKLG
jgi:nitrogen-specific signal transduction histidine kinase